MGTITKARKYIGKRNRLDKPELLAPAGNLEKLKFAVHYGADAVYIGGQKYGLRSNADNFSFEEMREGVEFANKYGAKVLVVPISMPTMKILPELRSTCAICTRREFMPLSSLIRLLYPWHCALFLDWKCI